MNTFVINVMNKFGYIGILLLIMIENLFPPIPSEVILTLGGYVSIQDGSNLTLIGVVISSTIGSIIGAIILYFIGYMFNVNKLINMCDTKLFKILKIKKEGIIKSYDNFKKRGSIAVLYSRCIPIVRSLISIPAGINKMNFLLFIIYTTIGSLFWNFVLVYLGSLVGENYMLVVSIFKKYSNIMLILLIIIPLYKIIKKNMVK